jgi:hypothetical protein
MDETHLVITKTVTYAEACSIKVTYDSTYNSMTPLQRTIDLHKAVQGAVVDVYHQVSTSNKWQERMEEEEDPTYEPTEYEMAVDEQDAYRDECSREDMDPRNDAYCFVAGTSNDSEKITNRCILASRHMSTLFSCEFALCAIKKGEPFALDATYYHAKCAAENAKTCYDAAVAFVSARVGCVSNGASWSESAYISVMRRAYATLDYTRINLEQLVGIQSKAEPMTDRINRLLPIIVEDLEGIYASLDEVAKQNPIIVNSPEDDKTSSPAA